MRNKIIFLPGLNGIRAIAALGVLFSHVNLALISFGINDFSLFGFSEDGEARGWKLGEHGVTMFFVLSGFLITYLLLREFEQTNTVNIKNFYIRRILRIWPVYYIYILFAVILQRPFIAIDSTLAYYLAFCAHIPFIEKHNYMGMDHLWSISIEEQFYLFWPLLFLMIVVKKVFLNSISIVIITTLAFRAIVWYFLPYSEIAVFTVVNRFDCMLFGALGAFLFFNNYPIIAFFNTNIVQSLGWLVICLLIFSKFNVINWFVETVIIEFVTLIIMIGQIKKDHRIINLENRFFSYIGKISFGLYVYHPLVIVLLSKCLNFNIFNSNALNAMLVFLVVFFESLAISHLSYFYYEKWFLNRKLKFSIIESSNTKIVS